MKNVKNTRYGDMTGKKHIGSTFNVRNEGITSLEGSPDVVMGSYVCADNPVTSLEYSPKEVYGDFHCESTKITTLEGSPTKVGGSFNCGDNLHLKSFKGCPTNLVNFDCNGISDDIDVIKEVIENQIKAQAYYTNDGWIKFRQIEEDFNKYNISKRVTRASMRTLLGLDK